MAKTTEDILNSKITAVREHCIIYFLISGNDIVYIGKSEQGLYRVLRHIHESKYDFTHYNYMEVDKKNLSYYEKLYIKKFKPKYNIQFNWNNKPENEKYTIDENGKKRFKRKFNRKKFMALRKYDADAWSK